MKMNPTGRVVGHWLLPVILSLALFGQASAAAGYSNIFVFGDSASETGNYNAIGSPSPIAPYATGRWSNGPVWVEHLAGSLGLGVSASAAGGNNYAWGGAKTGGQPGPVPPLDLTVQKNLYLAGHSNVADPDALFVVWGGGNDVLTGDISASASNLGSIITDLAHAGAKNFLVPNLPDVGLLHPLAAQHNAALSTVLDNLDHTLAVNLTRFDVNALLNAVIADALGNGGHVFGLTNVSSPCYDNGNVCADPSSFLFWDTVHPTAAGHQIIGAAAFAQLAVPLPAGIWLLASAFATINVARRRRM